MNLNTQLQKLREIVVLEVRVARMRVRHQVQFLKEKIQELLEAFHQWLKALKKS